MHDSNITHRGGCHCGAVAFEFVAESRVKVYQCNCSVCHPFGFLHLIVPKHQFKLLKGQDNLSLDQFDSGIAQHYFCKTCGVKSFYIPRSNPDGISINYRCVEKGTLTEVIIEDFDGQNWEANADSLSHLA